MSSEHDRVLSYGTREARRPQQIIRPALRCIVYCILIVVVLAVVLDVFFAPTVGVNSRQRAYTVQCLSQLRQIGWMLKNYAQTHNGTYPDSIASLLLDGNNSQGLSKMLCCRATAATPATGPTTQAVIASTVYPATCSYQYLPPTSRPLKNQVILLEPTLVHAKGTAANVLLGDQSAKTIQNAQLQSILQQINAGTYPVILK